MASLKAGHGSGGARRRCRPVAVLTALAMVLLAGPAPVAVAGTPAKAGPPGAMAALGDSITRGFNACGGWPFYPYQDCTQRSWATGDRDDADSQYKRLLALNAGIAGRNYNNARTGAKVAELQAQAAAAGRSATKPELVTVLMGANDACTATEDAMTSVAEFRRQLDLGLDQISADMPDARIYVVSIPDIYLLWQLGRGTLLESSIWTSGSICQSMLANPGSDALADQQRRLRVRQRVSDFNVQLAEACDLRPHCRFDGGVVNRTSFTLDEVSNWDGFHPNDEGQRKLARAAWSGQFDYADRTAPVAPGVVAARQPDGVEGWYRAPVAVQATARSADAKASEYALRAGSPAANPTRWDRWTGPALTVDRAGRNQLQVRTVDTAGNTSASTTLDIALDEVSPTLDIAVPAATGKNGWHTRRPSLALSAADQLSGVHTTSCTVGDTVVPVADGRLEVPGEGILAVRCIVHDKAGNERAEARTVGVDTVAPTLHLTQQPDGKVGYWRGPATVRVAVSERLSRLDCTASRDGDRAPLVVDRDPDGTHATVTIAADGSHLLRCDGEDEAGLTVSATETVVIDSVPPTLALRQAREPDGENGWFRTAPAPVRVVAGAAETVGCSVDGNGRALDAPIGGSLDTVLDLTGDGTRTLACVAADVAGNTTERSLDVPIDTTPPSVVLRCPVGPLPLGASGQAVVEANDGDGSGLVDVPSSVAIDTRTPGPQRTRLVVRDRVGHETDASCDVLVAAPAADVDGPPSSGDDPAAVPVDAGSAIPGVAPNMDVPATSDAPTSGGGVRGQSAAGGARPEPAPRLILRLSRKHPRAGQRVRLTVLLRPASGPILRRRVVIERRVGRRWSRIATVRLDRRGRAVAVLRVAGRGPYRARFSAGP